MKRRPSIRNTAQRSNWVPRFATATNPVLAVFLLAAWFTPLDVLSRDVQFPCAQVRECSGIVAGRKIVVRIESGRLETILDSMHWTNYCALRTFFRDVTYANALFVAVGGSYFHEPGVIVTSRDGLAWTRRHKENKLNLYGVAGGPDLFVAVGDRGAILSSTDCIRWKTEASGISTLLASIAFGNSRFVAGGESGVILTSTDGKLWTANKLPSRVYVGVIAFSDGNFTVRSGGTIFISRNGVEWRTQIPACTGTRGRAL
jgi:photosystem II stability/assembly factor-like uncharacterized protein